MTNSPEITVLTIVYNGERYIAEAVESILNQTYMDFEYVIVDNNSTDSTPKILNEYAQKDARIKTVTETKQGILYTRNTGLQVAKGDWIAILDADDIAMPERLEKQLKFVKENPSVVLVGSGCIMIDEDGKFLKSYNYPCDHQSLVRHLENQGAFFPQSSAFFKKEVALRIKGYRFSAAEDYDLWLRLSMVGEIGCIGKPLIKLRRYVKSNSYNIEQRSYIVCKVVSLICYFRRRMGLSDPYMNGEDAWTDFVVWIRARMENLGAFEKGEAMRELCRIRYSKDNGLLYRIYKMASIMAFNRFARAALRDPSYLNKIARQLFEESKEVFND